MATMGRHTSKLVAKILTVGVVICCLLTFLPRVNLPSNLLQSPDEREQRSARESVAIPKTLSYAQVAQAMKEIAEKQKQTTHSRNSKGSNPLLEDSGSASKDDDPLPESCTVINQRPSYATDKASIIITLNLLGSEDPLLLVARILRRIPDHVSDDVIITAEDRMPDVVQQRLEEAVDRCVHCRLFFLDGTVYEHWNQASKFSHGQRLIFMDARVVPDVGWVEPLLFELNVNPWAVASPQLHLRNAEESISNVGLSRLELTWDLHVIRASLTEEQKLLVINGHVPSINQTAILKEVLAVRKDFFNLLGLFDIIPEASGGEHVSFSLKVLNCGGEILMPVCSRVFLDVASRAFVSPILPSSEAAFSLRSYASPSFRQRKSNVSAYYEANSKIWLDGFSSRLYSNSIYRRVKPLEQNQMSAYAWNRFHYTKYGKYANILKSNLMSMECEYTNFRYVMAKYQPDMTSPIRKTSHLGYIRSYDVMYAVGIIAESSLSSSSSSSLSLSVASEKGKVRGKGNSTSQSKHSGNNIITQRVRPRPLVYTRNSSLWIGPFAYVHGQFQYKRYWCVTVVDKDLVMAQCTKQASATQTFLFVNGVVRLAAGGGKSCIKYQTPDSISKPSSPKTGNAVSMKLVLVACDSQPPNTFNPRFIMDMELVQ